MNLGDALAEMNKNNVSKASKIQGDYEDYTEILAIKKKTTTNEDLLGNAIILDRYNGAGHRKI